MALLYKLNKELNILIYGIPFYMASYAFYVIISCMQMPYI